MDKYICVDFDGVIHSYMTPWTDSVTIPDPPVEGAMRWLCEMVLKPDYVVCIYSSRSKTYEGIEAMREWIKEHIHEAMMGVWTHEKVLNSLQFPDQKPPAFITIDDRAICFRGTFPSAREIDNFKPWFDKYKEVDK